MKNVFLKKTLFVSIIIAVVFSFFVNAANIPNDVVVIAMNQGIFKTFDPHVTYESPPDSYTRNCYTQLINIVYENNEFKIAPDTAYKWEVLSDGKTWKFYLKNNIVFDNGDPLTSEDVVYSIKRVLKLKKTPSWLFADILGLTEEGVKALDKYTVQIVTKSNPSNIVLTILGATVGSIVNSKVVQKMEVDGDMGSTWLTDHTAGAGPYSLVEWKRNELIDMKYNPKYWEGVPRIKRIMIRDVQQSTEQQLLLLKGDIDIATGILPESLAELSKNPDIQIVTNPSHTIEYVGMNAGWGPFKDVRVRQAVKYAIDYDAMINKVRVGYAIANQQINSVGYFGYTTNNPFKQDLEKAKKLLIEAGYPNGFEVELVTNTTETRKNEAIIVQENLAKIGIKVTINIMPAAQMYDKMRQQGINLIVAGWVNDYPDPDTVASAYTNHRVKQLAWRMMWYDDKAADLCEAAAKELNDAKRKALYNELTKYFFDNAPFANMYQPIGFLVANKAVKGLDKTYTGAYIHFDLYKLYK